MYEVMMMCSSTKIGELKNKLDQSIENGENFANIYELSTKIDRLLVDYYKNSYKEAK
jgi:hypothetical protein